MAASDSPQDSDTDGGDGGAESPTPSSSHNGVIHRTLSLRSAYHRMSKYLSNSSNNGYTSNSSGTTGGLFKISV